MSPTFPDLRPADRRSDAVLPDGRLLAWSEWGPVEGPVVILCTGAATSGSLGLDATVVADLGVRLVAIDRPGLGRSTHDPDRTLSSWAADVAAAGAGAGWANAAAIGFSQGGPFALALAAAGIVERVALVSAQDDLQSHDAQLDDHLRALLRSAQDSPAQLERDVAASTTAASFLEMVDHMSSEVDRRLYRTPAFAQLFAQAVEEAFVQGAEGYARDLATSLGSWSAAPETIQTPVTLWYGRMDSSPVHSPDHGATLATRLPRATRHVIEGEGGSLLWTRSREILADLLDRDHPRPQ